MGVTLKNLLQRRELGIRLATSPSSHADSSTIPLRWVSVTELLDPTPWLSGGEMILTTGMNLPTGSASIRRYVNGLVAADVVALGYGIGFTSDTVPESLVRAAEERSLPVLEIDRGTPFIAVSRALSELLAAAQLEELRKGLSGQHLLVRAAVRHGAEGVIRTTSKFLSGWSALFGADSRIIHVSPESSRDLADDMRGQLSPDQTRPPSSFSLVSDGSHTLGHGLHTPSGERGVLLAGRSTPFDPTERTFVSLAATLLFFEPLSEWEKRRAVRKSALMNVLLTDPDPDSQVLLALGGELLARKPLRVCSVTGSSTDLTLMGNQVKDTFGEAVTAAEAGGFLMIIIGSETHFRAILALASELRLHTGTAAAASYRELAECAKQSVTAARTAEELHRQVLSFEDLQTMLLPDFIDNPAFRNYSARLLAPLERYANDSGIDLIESLRVWLTHHGQTSPASAELGIHRHTLRYQLEKAARLLEADLDSADLRTRLWLAISYGSSGPADGRPGAAG